MPRPADLYAALSEASGRDVGKVMNSFTDQTGVPVVSAACRAGEGADASASFELRQEEYRTLDRKGPSNKLWHIPVCVVYEGAEKVERECMLLDSAEAKLDLGKRRAKGGGGACPTYFYANAGESGYDRIKLARADLDKLAKSGLGKLSDLERFGLVSNAWAGVWSGDLPASAYFDVLGNFKKESSRLVWREIIDSLYAADKAVVTDAARPAFAKYVRDLLGADRATPRLDDQKRRVRRAEALAGVGADRARVARQRRMGARAGQARGRSVARRSVPSRRRPCQSGAPRRCQATERRALRSSQVNASISAYARGARRGPVGAGRLRRAEIRRARARFHDQSHGQIGGPQVHPRSAQLAPRDP